MCKQSDPVTVVPGYTQYTRKQLSHNSPVEMLTTYYILVFRKCFTVYRKDTAWACYSILRLYTKPPSYENNLFS